MEQNKFGTAEEVLGRAMLSLTIIGLLIINTMSYLLRSSLLLGQNIARMLGMTVTTTQQSKSSLEMEEWLQSSIGTTSSDLKSRPIVSRITECEVGFCMASEDGQSFCQEFSNKKLLMPLDLPDLPLCDYHAEMFASWTDDDTIRELVEIMTDEDGMDYLKEITDDYPED
jgi:hypothetical protein